MESHSDSSVINISFNELYKFYTASNKQRCAFKSLVLNNSIHFRVDLFPNGQNKEQLGYVQFIVVSNKLPPNIKSVIVLCRLYCKQVHILHKEIKIFNKGNETISWPIYYLRRDECKQYNTHYNKSHLQFGCDLQLLHIQYHNNSIMGNLKLKIRKNGVKNDTENVFHYNQLRTNSQVQYEWNITDTNIALFKNCRNGNAYYSNDINNIWTLAAFPNGQYPHNEGQLLLALKLIRLPAKIRNIEAQLNLSFQLQHKTQSYDRPHNKLFSYTDNEYIWSIDSLPTFNLFNNDRIALKFVVVIEIKKLFEDIGKNKGKEISRNNWNKYGVDILGKPEQSNVIDECQCAENRQKYSKSMVSFKQQSIQKQRSIRSQTHGYISPTSPYETTSSVNTFPRDLPPMSSTNTQSNRLSLDYSSIRSSFTNKMQPSLYKKITPTHTVTTPTIMEEQKTFNEMNIHQIKFKEWLNEIGLVKYFDYFERNDNADIRDVASFDHQTLISIGITNTPHRNRIVESAMQYKIMIKEFDETFKKNKILNNCAHEFKRNGILTLNDLQNMNKNELGCMLNNKEDVDDIWNLIHPESHLTSAINQLEDTHNIVMSEMDRLMFEVSEMNNKIKASNIISPSAGIKEKYDQIVDKTYRQLTQHHTQLNEFKSKYTDNFTIHSSRRLKKNRHSTNTVCSINSSSKESMNTSTTSSEHTSSVNYPVSHLSSKNITEGIVKDILRNSNEYKKYKLFVYGYIRLTAMEFNMIFPVEIVNCFMKFYEMEYK